MPFGLKDTDYKLIKTIFQLFPKIDEVLVFGSRAMGTEKPGSDVDLALKGSDIQLDDILKLKHKLEELPIIYDFDIINYETINTPALVEHIDKHGISFYKKQETPSEWKTYKLSDITSRIGDGLHGTPKYDENGEFYFINGSNLVNGKIVINSNTQKVNKTEFDKHKKDLSDRTILLGINGTIGNVALYNNEKCILGKSAAYLNIKNSFDKQFVRYVLTNEHFQNFIKTNASGTTIKNVGLGLLREYEFTAPKDKNTQTAIAQILTSLDDKIELNLQMNQTLETMAQAIFKEWFVNFNFPGFDGELVNGLPKGWKKTTIGSIALNIQYGYTQSSSSEEVGPKFLRITDIQKGTVDWTQVPYCPISDTEFEKYRIQDHDIFVARTGASTGENIYIIEPPRAVFASYLIRIQFRNPELAFYIGKFMRRQEYFSYIASSLGGSAQPNANAKTLTNIEIITPEARLLKLYFDYVFPLQNRIVHNQKQIQTLTQTRDTLLPKLMSGKIEIKA